MSGRWFYTRDGAPNGPFSTEEMKSLAGRKILWPTDWIWQEGQERKDGSLAESEFDFSEQAATAGLPDWLNDVANIGPEPKVELIAERLPKLDNPEWLEDLRLWIGLEAPAPAKKSERTEALPSRPAQEPPAAPPKVAPVPANPLAEKMRAESGFDPDTGQIFDPDKFRKWQQSQSQTPVGGQPGVSNAGLIDAFRRGRIAIDAWIDDEQNRLRVFHGEIEEIKRHPAIKAILDEFGRYGQDIKYKLLRHLEFTIENRKKYMKATDGRT